MGYCFDIADRDIGLVSWPILFNQVFVQQCFLVPGSLP